MVSVISVVMIVLMRMMLKLRSVGLVCVFMMVLFFCLDFEVDYLGYDEGV